MKIFIDDYFAEVLKGDAAIFAGAGLSLPAGFVDWRNLLRPLAEELGFDIDRETDLVTIAQFHVNANKNNRSRLHKAIIQALSAENPPTKNHKLLAKLPILTWWTTNYDQLIEKSLRDAGKIVDVKIDVPQLANTRPGREAIVYKMHGDVDHPSEAVVTRDDYEKYAIERGAFINALSGDLISKTFLFIGFSFTDPNLDQVLSRLRLTFKKNQREHFALFKKRTQNKNEDDASFRHAELRQLLVLEDLRRFNVHAITLDEYSEVTDIISEFARRFRMLSVFVSSSALSFEPWGEEQVIMFMRTLGAALVKSGTRIATGMGRGVGDALFTGALEEVMRRGGHIEDYLTIRPFPRSIADREERERVYTQYRKEIIGNAGFAIFLFGNLLTEGAVHLAKGVESEFDIATKLGLIPLPIGATGSMAEILSKWVFDAPDGNFGLTANQMKKLVDLAAPVKDLMTLIDPIVDLVKSVREGK